MTRTLVILVALTVVACSSSGGSAGDAGHDSGVGVVDAGVDAGLSPTLGMSRGEVFEGAGPQSRLVRVQMSLHNQTNRPLSLLPPLFKLHLSSGIEVQGSIQATSQMKEPCPGGDVSVDATASCAVGFEVDLSNPQTTITGFSYTLVDQTQLLVASPIPTCDQCGQLLGCPDFQRSDFACGSCAIVCQPGEACLASTCTPTVVVAPRASTCQASCAPKRCASVVVLSGCSPAPTFDFACMTDLTSANCPAQVQCVCEK